MQYVPAMGRTAAQERQATPVLGWQARHRSCLGRIRGNREVSPVHTKEGLPPTQGPESIEHYQFVLINDGGLYGIHGMPQG